MLFENMTADSHYYWFLARSADSLLYGLARIEKGQESVRFVSLPFELCEADSVFVDLLVADGKIYLVPKCSEYMMIYDIGYDKWDRKRIAEPDKNRTKYPYKVNQKFSTAVHYKDYLYLFPNFYPTFLRYHLKTGEMEYLYESMEVLNRYQFHDSFGFCDHVRVEGTKAVFFSKCYGMLLQFDLETCDLEIVEQFGLNEIFGSFEDDGENCWLISLQDIRSIIKYNKKSREKKILRNRVSGFISGRVPFFWTTVLDGYVWLLPGLSNMALKIDIATDTITEAEPFRLSNIKIKLKKEWWKFSFLKKIDNELFAFDTTGNLLVHYVSQGRCERKGFCLSAFEWTKIEYNKLSAMIKSKGMYRSTYSLKEIEFQNMVGKSIYRRCIAEQENSDTGREV